MQCTTKCNAPHLWAIQGLVDAVLKELSSQLAVLYSHTGRPSIACEKLLWAVLLRVLYTLPSKRLLMEQLDEDVLFQGLWGLTWMTPMEFHVTDRPSPDRTFCRAMPV